jgi:hypothetical protein
MFEGLIICFFDGQGCRWKRYIQAKKRKGKWGEDFRIRGNESWRVKV